MSCSSSSTLKAIKVQRTEWRSRCSKVYYGALGKLVAHTGQWAVNKSAVTTCGWHTVVNNKWLSPTKSLLTFVPLRVRYAHTKQELLVGIWRSIQTEINGLNFPCLVWQQQRRRVCIRRRFTSPSISIQHHSWSCVKVGSRWNIYLYWSTNRSVLDVRIEWMWIWAAISLALEKRFPLCGCFVCLLACSLGYSNFHTHTTVSLLCDALVDPLTKEISRYKTEKWEGGQIND